MYCLLFALLMYNLELISTWLKYNILLHHNFLDDFMTSHAKISLTSAIISFSNEKIDALSFHDHACLFMSNLLYIILSHFFYDLSYRFTLLNFDLLYLNAIW